MLLELALVIPLFGCRAQPKLDNIILSYSGSNSACIGCLRFRVDFRSGGHVNYDCLGSCAVPGEQHHLVPAQRFQEMVQAFHAAGFFTIPRTDASRMVADAAVIRLTYRDQRRIHEVVDDERHIPQVTGLENRMKAATEVDRYLKPSLALYRRLVDSGWDVNSLGPDRQNALFAAVVSRDLEATRFLLQHGSKVTGQTPELAAIGENIGILRLVVSATEVKMTSGRGAAILAQAARGRRTDLVQFLLDSGAGVNSRGRGQGWTPLLSAVSSGSSGNAGLFLNKGADAIAQDHSGRAALWYAATLENAGLITLLLKHGADVNARDHEGRTALMHAADLCYTWSIRALLDAGADPTIHDKRGRTALEPQLVSVVDPKCATARRMIEDSVRSRPAARQP
jgi:ankyrin repeat protein